jgi:hypothetical protein
MTAQLGQELAADSGTADDGDDGDTIVVASEIAESIEKEGDEAGDTITVATE